MHVAEVPLTTECMMQQVCQEVEVHGGGSIGIVRAGFMGLVLGEAEISSVEEEQIK